MPKKHRLFCLHSGHRLARSFCFTNNHRNWMLLRTMSSHFLRRDIWCVFVAIFFFLKKLFFPFRKFKALSISLPASLTLLHYATKTTPPSYRSKHPSNQIKKIKRAKSETIAKRMQTKSLTNANSFLTLAQGEVSGASSDWDLNGQ